jgi:hypothetical protein
MNKNRLVLLSVVLLSFLALACAEKPASATSSAQSTAPKGPQITLAPTRLPQSGVTHMHGTGFTPNSDTVSHLKRPDGSEFPTVNFFTNDKGEIDHDIESFLLQIGTHEVWVIDSKTKVSSNVAKFETTREQMPLAK